MIDPFNPFDRNRNDEDRRGKDKFRIIYDTWGFPLILLGWIIWALYAWITG
ncbi:hypothetical protein [Pseudalkalibacillus caeni]|uniref:hypothetical protein n=1 Tax=Exobacillus caeni TaxID=2574798 RepID=UPI001485A981|nr:hypothetical protein [Pseudalkalibacillus caeni]